MKRKFKLIFGSIENPHSTSYYDTDVERKCQMWAHRLSNRPDLAWHNDPADPGITTNIRMTNESLKFCPKGFQIRVKAIIQENNALTTDIYSHSIDGSAEHLIELVKAAIPLINQDNRKETNNRILFLKEKLQYAIEDLDEWMNGTKEEQEKYS